jgi:hypothetical protein
MREENQLECVAWWPSSKVGLADDAVGSTGFDREFTVCLE